MSESECWVEAVSPSVELGVSLIHRGHRQTSLLQCASAQVVAADQGAECTATRGDVARNDERGSNALDGERQFLSALQRRRRGQETTVDECARVEVVALQEAVDQLFTQERIGLLRLKQRKEQVECRNRRTLGTRATGEVLAVREAPHRAPHAVFED